MPRSRGLVGTQMRPSSAGPATPPPPLRASVSPLELGLGAHNSQGSGAAGTTEAGHGRRSPWGGHAPARTGLRAPQPLSGSAPRPQPAARKSTQPTSTSGLDTKGRDTMVSGECPPTTPGCSPGSQVQAERRGRHECRVSCEGQARATTTSCDGRQTALKGNVCRFNNTQRLP